MATRHRLVAITSAGLVMGQWGCAMQPPRILPPPPERVRAQFGSVAIASRSLISRSAVGSPTSGKGAGGAKGAGLGALYVILGGLEVGAASGAGGNPLAIIPMVLGIVLAPVGALTGGIYGVIAAAPAETVKEAEAALAKAVAESNVQEAVRDQVWEAARRRTSHRVHKLAEGDSPHSAGVDTILEITVQALALVGPTGVDPSLSIVLRGSAKLIRTADGAEIYPEASFAYLSVPRKFVEWGADEAHLFRGAMQTAYEDLSEKIVDDIFLVHIPPGRRWTNR